MVGRQCSSGTTLPSLLQCEKCWGSFVFACHTCHSRQHARLACQCHFGHGFAIQFPGHQEGYVFEEAREVVPKKIQARCGVWRKETMPCAQSTINSSLHLPPRPEIMGNGTVSCIAQCHQLPSCSSTGTHNSFSEHSMPRSLSSLTGFVHQDLNSWTCRHRFPLRVRCTAQETTAPAPQPAVTFI